MLSGRAVPLSYFGYAVLLGLGALVWAAAVFDYVAYGRVEAGLLDPRWLDAARALLGLSGPALWAGLATGLAATVLAALPIGHPGPLIRAHRRYQLRFAPVALLFVVVVELARVRIGAFDADVAAAAVFAWSVWIVAAGWRAFACGRDRSGPALWWLALTIDAVLLAVFAFFVIMIEIEGMRMF